MGIESLLQQNVQNAGLAGTDRLARNAMFPQSQMDKTQYAVSSQLPTGAQTIASDYDTPTNAYTGLPLQLASGGIAALRYDDGGDVEAPVEQAQPATMDELAARLNDYYRGNENYDDVWKQFAATKEQDPEEWYRKQLEFLGGQEGWQIGQNTSGRNAALQPQIQDTIAQAKAAGLGEDEINSILGNSRQSANYANQQRIINQQQAGHGPMGMTTQDYLTVAAILGGGAAAGYFAPAAGAAGALEGGGALTTTELMGGAGGAFTPAAGSGASFTIAPGAYTAAGVAGAGEAAAQGLSLKDAYNAYKYGKMGLGALNSLSGAGGTGGSSGTSGGQYAGQGINPYASTGFNPGPVRSGLGISDYNPLQTQPTFLSKLSEFKNMAAGGIADLGGYSDGGRLLKGPGDGMSDHIPATIGAKQPARLAEGEFVVPADVVSHLGNGSTDAGAKQLYKMMDNIRKARTGNPKQGKQINPDKFTPKG